MQVEDVQGDAVGTPKRRWRRIAQRRYRCAELPESALTDTFWPQAGWMAGWRMAMMAILCNSHCRKSNHRAILSDCTSKLLHVAVLPHVAVLRPEFSAESWARAQMLLADNSFFALACLAHPCTLVPHKSCKSMVRFGSGMVIAHFISGFKSSFDLHFLSCLCHHPPAQSEEEPRSWFWACSEGFQTVYQYHCRLVRVHCQRHALQIATAHRETTAVVNIPATDWNHAKEKEIYTRSVHQTLSRFGQQQMYLRQKQTSPVHDAGG